MRARFPLIVAAVCATFPSTLPASEKVVVLEGTQPLTVEGDIAAMLVEGVDRFLLNELARSVERRASHWNRDFSSAEAYNKSIEPNRKRLAHILGVRDERVPFRAPDWVVSMDKTDTGLGSEPGFFIFAVRWPVLRFPGSESIATASVHAEGLLLVPARKRIADIVAIPDADQTPEQIAGLSPGIPPESQFARRLAENGCRVLIPTLVSRERKQRTRPGGSGGATLTSREFIYRPAFELGRHLIGYEVQKVLAGVDWFVKDASDSGREAEGENARPVEGTLDSHIGVIGYGEGGLIALYAAALDTRIDVASVSGSFEPRESIWQQPIDRNVFGLIEQFGDAELAMMVFPRKLLIDTSTGPEVQLPGEGGAPAHLPLLDTARSLDEFERLVAMDDKWEEQHPDARGWAEANPGTGQRGRHVHPETIERLLTLVDGKVTTPPAAELPDRRLDLPDAESRQQRQVEELDRHNQWLLRESPFVRNDFMAKLDTSSVAAYDESVKKYREHFRKEVIGDFGYDLLPPNARTRKAYDTDKWVGYEVVLDVWPIDGEPETVGDTASGARNSAFTNVIAYGVLLLPKDLKRDGSEQRPVVVCQHGLEGRPQDIITGDHRAYRDFAAKLAERGFITFAPQNLYIGQDKFRTLQRKANPLGKTLFSIITPQHQQIVDWLQTLPYVDDERIAFYGLSYGGKTAMRVPALVTDYCLSICSADFNEWVLKNASTRHPFSYVWTGEYEIFEFDLGSTFNYAEMAALICPRPFMVERGHFDGVGWDEYVAYEYAKVRHLYQARLGIGDRTEIEWFAGPHTINGQGTYAFLHKHLGWPEPAAAATAASTE